MKNLPLQSIEYSRTFQSPDLEISLTLNLILKLVGPRVGLAELEHGIRCREPTNRPSNGYSVPNRIPFAPEPIERNHPGQVRYNIIASAD
jgi:hypothetical protein